MPQRSSRASLMGSLAVIAAIVGGSAGAFAYTAGWFSPERLTADKMVDAFAPPGGPTLGHRRNHAKGICFTGVFESNGRGAQLSRAQVFSEGRHPTLGRLNLGTTSPDAPDASARVRGLGLQISSQDGEVWRSAMIDTPVFSSATGKGFYDFLRAAGSTGPDAMTQFQAEHPEFGPFAEWASTAPWTGSYAEDAFNGLNAFTFVNATGEEHAVRWSFVPEAKPVPITPDELAKRGPNYLAQEITARVAASPQRWTLLLTVANPGDPTSDPTKRWPDDRRTVAAGTLILERIEPEPDGACRDIVFDPTILPNGMRVSDDPIPAARSAAYAKSYDRRTAEAKDYPHTASKAQ